MYSWSTTFSDLFTRCRYLIVIVIPEGSYLLGWKACSSYPDAVSDYVCISSLYRIIELNWERSGNQFGRLKKVDKISKNPKSAPVDIEGISPNKEYLFVRPNKKKTNYSLFSNLIIVSTFYWIWFNFEIIWWNFGI